MKKTTPQNRTLNLAGCPVCGSRTLRLYEDKTPAGSSQLLVPGELAGVVYDDAKTGNYDWQYNVVGVICHKQHRFWVESEL